MIVTDVGARGVQLVVYDEAGDARSVDVSRRLDVQLYGRGQPADHAY